jgi:hypothetical protein
MDLNINIVLLLMLNIGLMLALAYYGSQLFGSRRLADSAYAQLSSRFSGLNAALHISRPVKRHAIPRMRVKTDSDDEPPHMPS